MSLVNFGRGDSKPSELGQTAEDMACAFLRRRGLRLIERNYRCPRGEIDLVMQDGEQLVFVEVRYRRGGAFGGPQESITAKKQARLLAAARHYLATHSGDPACRFDVIALSGEGYETLDWIRDAFRPLD